MFRFNHRLFWCLDLIIHQHMIVFSREEDMLDMAVFLKENSRLGWYK
jgi:hypothetical protein